MAQRLQALHSVEAISEARFMNWALTLPFFLIIFQMVCLTLPTGE
jgi:bacteriorhodopsin